MARGELAFSRTNSQSKNMSEEQPMEEEDIITLLLKDGEEVRCSAARLSKHSRYFQALLSSGMTETQTKTIRLLQLDPRAVRCFLRFTEDQELEVWDGSINWESEDGARIEEAFDYLQVNDDSDQSDDLTLSAIQIFREVSTIRKECLAQGWMDQETNAICALPEGKKKRAWRLWVCYLLCLNILPMAKERIDQQDFTQKLKDVEGAGGPVALRRELVEYELIQREGDGSAYWRPNYTIAMARRWLKGMPRKIV
jgi:hypothetical protein